MRRLLSVCAVLLLLGAGCPLWPAAKTVTPAPSAPPTEEPAPAPAPAPAPEPEPKGPIAGGCRRTGCSSQLCADEDMVSTCEYREEYGCYKNATCERQTDGKCGWTATDALTACLNTAQDGPIPL